MSPDTRSPNLYHVMRFIQCDRTEFNEWCISKFKETSDSVRILKSRQMFGEGTLITFSRNVWRAILDTQNTKEGLGDKEICANGVVDRREEVGGREGNRQTDRRIISITLTRAITLFSGFDRFTQYHQASFDRMKFGDVFIF